MSFRKRNEIISSRTPANTRVPVNTRIPIAASGPIIGDSSRKTNTKSTKNPCIKPSIITSNPCISTGSKDLDKFLLHGGIPVGSLILIEENGSTDFSSSLIKIFLSQGIVQNRIEHFKNEIFTQNIVVGLDQNWSKQLPGLYKGNSKEMKKKKIKSEESKLSISNIIEGSNGGNKESKNHTKSNINNNNELKIAWRYGLQKKHKEESKDDEESDENEFFNNQFDITTVLTPSANLNELSNVDLAEDYNLVIKKIDYLVKKFKDKLIRISIPLFLNPIIYNKKELLKTNKIFKFLYELKRLVKKNSDRVVLVLSINLDLYGKDSSLITLLENEIFDGIIELKSFEPKLYEMMEKIYKKEPSKIKHGHINVFKIPILSEIGLMEVKEMEYSFKNGRKRFEIEEWSIPVEEDDDDSANTKSSNKEDVKW